MQLFFKPLKCQSNAAHSENVWKWHFFSDWTEFVSHLQRLMWASRTRFEPPLSPLTLYTALLVTSTLLCPGGASLTIVALCVCVCVGIYCDSYIKVQYSTPFCRETSEAFSLLFFKKKKKRKAPYFSPRPPLKMHLVPIPSHSDLSEYRKLCRTLTLWADVFRFQLPSPYSGVSTRHSAGILG